MRPLEWLDRESWSDVHDDVVTFTLTAPIGLDVLAGHLILGNRGHWRFATNDDSSAAAGHAISDLYAQRARLDYRLAAQN
jgi:hypothetical protein